MGKMREVRAIVGFKGLSRCSVGATRRTLDFLVRFEVFMAVTMENDVFRDIKPQFMPHRRHITSPLQSSAG
jgi:hypothetical protein